MLARRCRNIAAGCIAVCTLFVLSAAPVSAERVKDLAKIAGVRDNPLVGYGFVPLAT